MTISHVCHNWRDIALSLPALWAFVELCPKNDRPGRLEIMIMLLERSRGHPLDVSIRFEHDDDTISNYDSDHGGEDLQHDRPGGRLAAQGPTYFPLLRCSCALALSFDS